MSEDCCGGHGCGCQATSFYTSFVCPDCAGKLRASGNPQTIRYRLICPTCGHMGRELSVEEFRAIID